MTVGVGVSRVCWLGGRPPPFRRRRCDLRFCGCCWLWVVSWRCCFLAVFGHGRAVSWGFSFLCSIWFVGVWGVSWRCAVLGCLCWWGHVFVAFLLLIYCVREPVSGTGCLFGACYVFGVAQREQPGPAARRVAAPLPTKEIEMSVVEFLTQFGAETVMAAIEEIMIAARGGDWGYGALATVMGGDLEGARAVVNLAAAVFGH